MINNFIALPSIMDHYTIATSLKRVDKKFTEELTEQERQAAYRKFKKAYAEQMAKLAGEISKRQRIQENIEQIGEKEEARARERQEDISKRMEKHTLNKEKYQLTLEKEIKMLDDNWKRKLEEITRKNREREKEAFRKAEKIRKDGEQFWRKKALTQRDPKDESSKGQAFVSHSKQEREFLPAKTEEKKLKFLLPNLKKAKNNLKVSASKTTKQESAEEGSKDEDVRLHLSRTEKKRKEIEQQNFQKIMQKLEKIETSRRVAHEKMANEIKEAKRVRELRESPQVHAANRQRSIEQLHSRSKKKELGLGLGSRGSLSGSKSSVSNSREKHLQVKKRLAQEQLEEREHSYSIKQERVKRNKINRMIKEAINQIKQKTLNSKD